MSHVESILPKYFNRRAEHGDILKIEKARHGSDRFLSDIFREIIPPELGDLYRCCDGFAVSGGAASDWNWILPRCDSLGGFIESRRWFSSTHRELSERYYPIMNFDGNSLGYLEVGSGYFDRSLYLFQHDDYLHEPDQPWAEFLHCLDQGIADYLEYEMKFY